jgi:hypothetical protein
MAAPTTRIPAQLVNDLNETLFRLKQARIFDDLTQVMVLERRLDWLCDRIPRKDT